MTVTTRRVSLRSLSIAPEKLGFFRWGRVGDRVIVTTDTGAWHLLEPAAFEDLLAGRLDARHQEHGALQAKGFLRDGLDLDEVAARMRQKKAFVGVGPHLHIVITTLRCNQSCQYCHASRTTMDRVDTDMSLETAKQVVDLAMQSTSPYLAFEYQGGEPTVNMPALKFMVEYSREKNRQEKKEIDHSVVTNFTYMTQENADWLLDNQVLVCTSLDGPEALHNENRRWQKGSNAFEHVMRWMDYFNRGYVARGLDPELWHVDALMTTTRKSFDHVKEIVDLYVSLGIRTLRIRPLNPYGFANATWKAIGYTVEEYLDFYARCLDYMLELNRQGTTIVEGTAVSFLTKMLTAEDPNFVDVRSPCGAGTGQVAYNHDGKVFTCDEARMVYAEGDDALFQIGTLGASTYDEVQLHPTVRAIAVASLQDTLPGCATCWNKPYCGVCPMHNYQTSGDLFGQRPNSFKCKEHYTIASLLFERLANDPDGVDERIFREWIKKRPRQQGACIEV